MASWEDTAPPVPGGAADAVVDRPVGCSRRLPAVYVGRAAGLVRVPARSSSPSACAVDAGLRPVLGAESGDGLLELFAQIVETIPFCVIDGGADRRD
jgi:hypothetical protein